MTKLIIQLLLKFHHKLKRKFNKENSMTKQTHTSGGICISLINMNYFVTKFLFPYNIPYKILLIGLFFHSAFIGSLFPDIDMKKSSISKMYPFLSKHFGSRCKHRGFTHSILCVTLIGLIAEVLLLISSSNIIIFTVSFGFLSGYISHLLLDLITYEGIQAFYPWKQNIRIGWIKTGSTVENYIDKLIKFINFVLIIYNIFLLSELLFGISILDTLLM